MTGEIGIGEALLVIFAVLAIGATILMTASVMRMSKDFGEVRDKIRDIELELKASAELDARFNFQSEMLLVLAGSLYRTNALLYAFFKFQLDSTLSAKAEPNARSALNVLVNELHVRNLEVAENIDFFKVLVDPNDEVIDTLAEKRPTKNTIDFLKRLAESSSVEARTRLRAKFDSVVARVIGIKSARWTGRP